MTLILYGAVPFAAVILAAALADWLAQRWLTRPAKIRRSADEQYVRELVRPYDLAWERHWHAVMHELAEGGASMIAHEYRHRGRVYLLPKERRVVR